MTYKYSCDQSNHSYDLHYDFQNWYDWLIVPLLLMAQRSETVRQTRSCYTYNAATLLPPRSQQQQKATPYA